MPLRISILAVGRAKDGPEADLFQSYLRRLPWEVTLREVEDRRKLPAPERTLREGELLLRAAPKGARLIALDERGKSWSSQEFASRLGRWLDEGSGDLCFVIGGADGLSANIRDKAELLLSLGAMTWPHLLVRAMLAEQLYRAHSILTGHPYHRA